MIGTTGKTAAALGGLTCDTAAAGRCKKGRGQEASIVSVWCLGVGNVHECIHAATCTAAGAAAAGVGVIYRRFLWLLVKGGGACGMVEVV